MHEILVSLIPGNNVSFLWSDGYEETEEGDGPEDEGGIPALTADQGELVRWLLGGEDAASVWPSASPEVLAELSRVRRPGQMLLDEMV